MYIDLLESQISSNHPALVQLVKQCLHNDPRQRPSTDELLATLQRMKVEVEGEYGGSSIRLDMVRVRLAKEVKELKQQQVCVILVIDCHSHCTIIQERYEVEAEAMTREVEEKTREVEEKTREVEEKTREVEEKTREVEEKTREVEEKTREVEEKTREVDEKTREVEVRDMLCIIVSHYHRHTLCR